MRPQRNQYSNKIGEIPLKEYSIDELSEFLKDETEMKTHSNIHSNSSQTQNNANCSSTFLTTKKENIEPASKFSITPNNSSAYSQNQSKQVSKNTKKEPIEITPKNKDSGKYQKDYDKAKERLKSNGKPKNGKPDSSTKLDSNDNLSHYNTHGSTNYGGGYSSISNNKNSTSKGKHGIDDYDAHDRYIIEKYDKADDRNSEIQEYNEDYYGMDPDLTDNNVDFEAYYKQEEENYECQKNKGGFRNNSQYSDGSQNKLESHEKSNQSNKVNSNQDFQDMSKFENSKKHLKTGLETAMTNIENRFGVPSKNHHPKMIDDDTERFKFRLDDMLNKFRLDTLNEFMEAKKGLLEDQISAISSERNNYEQILNEKMKELGETKEALAKNIQVLEKKNSSILKMSEIIGRERFMKIKFKTAGKAFLGWKIFCNLSKKMKQHKQMLANFQRKKMLKKAYNGFRQLYTNRIKRKTEESISGKMGSQMEDMCMKYQKQIDTLERNLADANSTVNALEQSKVDIQQNLKNAFQKGQCAMNFEAMNVLGTGQQQQMQQHMQQQMGMQSLPFSNEEINKKIDNNLLTGLQNFGTVADSLGKKLEDSNPGIYQNNSPYNNRHYESIDDTRHMESQQLGADFQNTFSSEMSFGNTKSMKMHTYPGHNTKSPDYDIRHNENQLKDLEVKDLNNPNDQPFDFETSDVNAVYEKYREENLGFFKQAEELARKELNDERYANTHSGAKTGSNSELEIKTIDEYITKTNVGGFGNKESIKKSTGIISEPKVFFIQKNKNRPRVRNISGNKLQ